MRSFLIFLTSLLAGSASCQSDTLAFPDEWTGKWTGTLEIFSAVGKVQELPMELEIRPLDTLPRAWTWTILYGTDPSTGTRPYTLIETDREKGAYRIDENNSISMEGYFMGGKFYQFFEVMGSRLLTTTSRSNDLLIWEIAVSSNEPVSETGGQEFDGEEIPPVYTYPVTGVQRASLRRQ